MPPLCQRERSLTFLTVANASAFSAAMPQTDDPPLPPQLQGVPREVLEAYVGSRLRSHIRARGLALGLSEGTIQALALPCSAEVAPEGAAATAPPPPPTGRGGSSGAFPNNVPGSSSGSRGERQGGTESAAGSPGCAATRALVFFHDCQ